MRKKRFIRGAIGIAAVAAVVAGITALIGPTGSSAADGDHYVDNLGDGTTAADFDGNSSEDCTSETFLAGNYDLWHFVVNQATDPDTFLSWNSTNSLWSNPSEVTVVDVTEDYGDYTNGEKNKQLWIATTPVGATLETAYLDYEGSAGSEVLSHACGGSGTTPSIEIDPIITYDMTWDWDVDKTVDWSVNPLGGYILDYSIEAHRSETQRVLPMTLHVTDSVLVTPPSLVLTNLEVTFTQGSYTQDCAVDLAKLKYDCELDVTKVAIDSSTGRPTGTGILSGAATYFGGTLTDTTTVDFDTAEPSTVYAQTASITDDYATPMNMADDYSTEESMLEYSTNWVPSDTECTERTNTSTLLIDNPAPGMDNPTDAVTVRWCPPMPGLTIGYWSNKTGSPVVVANFAALNAEYPNALGWFPNLNTATAVRNFFRNATCNDTCRSMFTAQFLATAMNALDEDFGDQGVMFDDTCMSVSDLLTAANAGAVDAAKGWYVMFKSTFDDINNSRADTCLTVID